MHHKRILIHVEPLKSFFSRKQRRVEVPGGEPFLEVDIEPRANGRPICSRCGTKRPGYDRLAARRFEWVPPRNMAVFFVYAMARLTLFFKGWSDFQPSDGPQVLVTGQKIFARGLDRWWTRMFFYLVMHGGEVPTRTVANRGTSYKG